MGDVDKLKNGGFTSRKVSNKCTKYYCNRTTHVQFVIRHVVTCFFSKSWCRWRTKQTQSIR